MKHRLYDRSRSHPDQGGSGFGVPALDESFATCNHLVVDREVRTADVDRIFAALGDTTRRDIVRRAALGEHSVSELSRHYVMSLTAVQKHVAVLERAGLVTKRRHGRESLVSTNVTTLQIARRQLEDLEKLWRGRLDRFGDALADRHHADQQH